MVAAISAPSCSIESHNRLKDSLLWCSLPIVGYQSDFDGVNKLELRNAPCCNSTLAVRVLTNPISRARLTRPGTANRTMRRRLPGYAALLTAQVGPWRAETRAQRHWRSGMGAVRERGGM